MKIDVETLDKARIDGNLTARLSLALGRSTRQIERYLKDKRFPDKLEEQVNEFFKPYRP